MQSFARTAQPGGCMDARVASAVSNWAPRFTTNGVAVADFQRVTASLERWDDWCSAWSAAAKVHEDLGREAMREGRTRSAGAHLSTAAVYYHFGKFLFVEHPEEMREAHGRAVACLNDALPYLDPAGERIEIPFEGSRLVGVLRRPNGPGPHPVVVMVPGLDSTQEEVRWTARARGRRSTTCRSAGTGRSPARRSSMRWPRNRASTRSGSASGA